MDAALARRIERNAELAASAMFAGAVGYAAYTYLLSALAQPALSACAGGVGALAYLIAAGGQRALQPAARLAVPIFDVRQIEGPTAQEPLPIDQHRAVAEDAGKGPLVLDDVLAELGPDSRVVRLFDASAMQTAGELKARIDRHLDEVSSEFGAPDASQALSDALAELRRSLR